MAKILIHTLGSSGDLNPFVALAFELRRRGHEIHMALSPLQSARVRPLGLNCSEIGADPDWQSDLMRRLLLTSQTKPIEILFREVLIPAIGPATRALEPLCQGCDLLVSHTIQLAAPAVAHRTGIPWVSALPATSCFPSGEQPPPGIAWKGCPATLSRLGWVLGRRLFAPLDALAAREYRVLDVPPRPDLVVSGGYSRRLTVGLWSPAYFPRPTDWPSWLQVGGYARWDAPPAVPLPPLVLPAGDGPLIVFTLGSSVVNFPRGFYETALNAVAPTSWRAVLLGATAEFPIPPTLRARVVAVPYAPYADLFPQAAAIVHQGGVGTTQAACFYGVPSVIVPRGFDQFENAAHVQREGVGLRLLSGSLSPIGLRLRLARLLGTPAIRQRVELLARRMQSEPGVGHSADLLEQVLADRKTSLAV